MDELLAQASTTLDPYIQLSSSYLSWVSTRFAEVGNTLQEHRSPLARHKYLEPEYLLVLLLVYILSAFIAPKFKYKIHLTPWALLHHGIALISSIFIPYYVILLAMQSNYKALCNSKPDINHDLIATQLAYIYATFYVFKAFELFDVVFAHLGNKKASSAFKFFQIMNVLFAWSAAFFAPYGDAYLPIVINCAVSILIHTAYIVRIAKWPVDVPSVSTCARYTMYVQCFLNLALGLYEYMNKCEYPDMILHPFIAYNFIAIFYALVTNNHAKQD